MDFLNDDFQETKEMIINLTYHLDNIEEMYNKILKEQSFQKTSSVDKASTVKMGKLLGVKYLLVGDIFILNDVLVINSRLVDAETGEFQKTLSDGQREHDLDIVHFNVAAELEDLALSGVLYPGMEPVRASEAVIRRYRRIWAALKERQLLDPKDRHAVERAMRQLHDLGFAVEEVAITIDGDTQMISFQPKLVAAGYHTQRLRDLTGLDAEELQAKRLLASFDRYNARENKLGISIQEMAKKWISEVFEPVISRVPDHMRGRVERAQMFHEILENRWYLSEKAGYDVGLDEATDNYCAEILPLRRDSGVDIVVE